MSEYVFRRGYFPELYQRRRLSPYVVPPVPEPLYPGGRLSLLFGTDPGGVFRTGYTPMMRQRWSSPAGTPIVILSYTAYRHVPSLTVDSSFMSQINRRKFTRPITARRSRPVLFTVT